MTPSVGPEPIEDWAHAAEHMGSAYLRYSFTKGTEQEVAFLVDVLGLERGRRVLDVGCGPGRHSRAFAARGIDVVGIDLAPRFAQLAAAGAPPSAAFAVADARALPLASASFDTVVSLCQGGFGLVGGDDLAVLHEIRRVLAPEGVAALTAFSAYFQVRHLEAGDTFDAAAGTTTETTAIKDEAGHDRDFRMTTTVFTPRELRLLCAAAGLTVSAIWSVTPGGYQKAPPTVETPEYLLLAVR